jgi:ferric-dicitrate binding protein FerR (iron transport regulator)
MSLIPEHIIIRALQKTADANDELILNNWFRENPRNVELFCQLQEIWNSKDRMNEESVAQKWAELYRRITDQQRGKHIPAINRPSYRMRYAAAILSGILIASAAWFGLQPNRKGTKEVLVQNVVFNHNGVQKLILPDSSVVWLNDNSRLTYTDKFDEDQRLVALEGKAFFEVWKNAAQPFVVRTDNMDVQVTGTTFFVHSETEDQALVTLVSGGVTLHLKNETGKIIRSERLVPGQQASVNRHSRELSVRNIDTSYYVAWKDGTFRFADEPLENIIRQLSLHYGVNIQITPALQKKRFTGRITPKHTISDVMDIINRSHPIRYKIEKNTIYIREK